MTFLDTVEALEAVYGAIDPNALTKVAHSLTPEYARWIAASNFCIISTVGPEGTDASPRGDEGEVARALDPQTLAIPDWRGNNRIDSLRNIVRDPRVSLMFMVPGSNNVVRVNGEARVSVDAGLIAAFDKNGRLPRSVIVIKIGEIYIQCARALLRSGLWVADVEKPDLPTAGDILRAMSNGTTDGATYDREWATRAAETLWSS